MKIKAVTKVLSQPFFQINSILLPTPRSQVAIFIKHEKLFFNIIPCNSELNRRLTTSLCSQHFIFFYSSIVLDLRTTNCQCRL
ncbi:hypothetical protein FIU45_00035 [Enterococcus faecium]|nr:hypothetical protein CRN00_09800 [Enterococcus faecium]TNX37018.1 hypothetical protein FIU45_00035 [Enterococcus faecium]